MAKFNLVEMVFDCLSSNPEQRFTARQLAEWIFQTYPERCREKQARSQATVIPIDSETALIQQIVAEIGSSRVRIQQKHPGIKTTEGRPRKYYFTHKTDTDEVETAETETKAEPLPSAGSAATLNEHDLYPLLSSYLMSELEVYSKRIDERRSRNTRGSGGNRWLFPDLVGMEDLSARWDREIRDCAKEYSDKRTRLWSFEVKLLVNRSNVREVYFQAVSNSSWANFGYLVAAEIEGSDTVRELRMLAGLHGIGFIRLDADNPAESQIIIPARERTDIDWDTANRLAQENRDFVDYVKLVRQFYQTGDARPRDWDGASG